MHDPSENDTVFAQTSQGQSENDGILVRKSKGQRSQGHSENDELLAHKSRGISKNYGLMAQNCKFLAKMTS